MSSFFRFILYNLETHIRSDLLVHLPEKGLMHHDKMAERLPAIHDWLCRTFHSTNNTIVMEKAPLKCHQRGRSLDVMVCEFMQLLRESMSRGLSLVQDDYWIVTLFIKNLDKAYQTEAIRRDNLSLDELISSELGTS